MSWFDDFTTKVMQSDSGKTSVTDIKSFLEEQSFDNTIKVAEEALGNLTAAEIAEGARGAARAMAPSHADANSTQNAASASQIAGKAVQFSLPLVLAAVAIFFLISKQGGKRG